jgi:hypothetical protein
MWIQVRIYEAPDGLLFIQMTLESIWIQVRIYEAPDGLLFI